MNHVATPKILTRCGSVLVLISAGVVAGCIESNDSPTEPAGVPPDGQVLVLKAPLTASDRGDLTVVSLASGLLRVLASEISDNDGLDIFGDIIFGVSYANAAETVVSVPLAGGTLTAVVPGHGPVTNGQGDVAYCNNDGQVVIDQADPALPNEIVADIRAFTGCVSLAWSSDGRLAFVARAPLGDRDAAVVTLFIRKTDGGLTPVSLAKEVRFGASAVSWSKDASALALYSEGEILVKEANTGNTVLRVAVTTPSSRPLMTHCSPCSNSNPVKRQLLGYIRTASRPPQGR